MRRLAMPRFPALPALTALAVLVAIAISACGGSSKPSSTNSKEAAFKRAGLQLARCMRANGVPNFPDPTDHNGAGIEIQKSVSGTGSNSNVTVNGVSVNSPDFQRAMNKCRKELPAPPPVSAAQIARLRAGALKFSECMRSHGVPNFQDPQISAGPNGRGIGIRMGALRGGGPVGPGSAPNRSSPTFDNALRICGSKNGFPAIRIGPGAP